MAKTYKKIAFLAPNSALTLDEFRHHWRHVHGPLVAGSPGYINYRLKYVQNHVLCQGPVGTEFKHPGIAAFWLPGDGSNEAAFSSTPTYRNHIKPDEEKFIDMNGTIAMSAVESVIMPGSGPAKLIVVSRRADSLDPDGFSCAYDRYAQALLAHDEFANGLRGWSVNHVVPGSFTLPGAYPASSLMVDCVEEFWFSGRGQMDAAFAMVANDEELKRLGSLLFDVDGRSSFVAEELVLFDRVPQVPVKR